MLKIKIFKNFSMGHEITWITPDPHRADQKENGIVHKNGAPYAIIVTDRGISFAEDSRLPTVTDYTIKQLKECIDSANRIYLKRWR